MTDHTHPPADYSFSDRHQENLRMSKTAPKWNVVKDALSPTHPPTATDPLDAVNAQLVGALRKIGIAAIAAAKA